MTLMAAHRLIGMRRRLLIEWLILVTVLTLLSTALTVWQDLPGIRDINHRAYDLSMQAVRAPAPSPDIAIIAIDDASIEALG